MDYVDGMDGIITGKYKGKVEEALRKYNEANPNMPLPDIYVLGPGTTINILRKKGFLES